MKTASVFIALLSAVATASPALELERRCLADGTECAGRIFECCSEVCQWPVGSSVRVCIPRDDCKLWGGYCTKGSECCSSLECRNNECK
ncbi:hypothetical protein BB8028_0002g05350 [Beauveria bassiana]|uniref:Uncharacterized protein n=1 Tax=Beauveria bassiana TaxID=176275 RepID=A0A2S7Y272_BEABA|nr:hypothetical protein BB8028_0002g05350 [Beauveria bassiana]